MLCKLWMLTLNCCYCTAVFSGFRPSHNEMCWSPELCRHESADRWCHPWQINKEMKTMMMKDPQSLSDHHWLSSKPEGRKRLSFPSTEWTHLPDVSGNFLQTCCECLLCSQISSVTLFCFDTQMPVGCSLNSRWAPNKTVALWYLMRTKLKLSRKNPNLRSGRRHLLPEPKRMNRNLRNGAMWRCESVLSCVLILPV